MADGIEVKVDATRGLARITRITPAVRDDLRGIIPSLINRLASLVDTKLGSELKTRTSLTVAREMHETTDELYGVARLESPSANGLLPSYLETGTKPHGIFGNPVLAFPWDFMGGYGGGVSANTTMAFFRSVKHPGTRAYRFMGSAFDEMHDTIVAELKRATGAAARKV